jgi:putative transposase
MPYFVSIAVVDKIALFQHDRLKQIITESLKFCIERKKFKLYGWCLMPDTLYLIVKSHDNKDLTSSIRDLKTYTSKTVMSLILKESFPEKEYLIKAFKKAASKNRKGTEYKLWIEGYYPVELYSPEFTCQKLFEIHGYPVHAGLVINKTDYAFSSARNYANIPFLIDITHIKDAMPSLKFFSITCPEN